MEIDNIWKTLSTNFKHSSDIEKKEKQPPKKDPYTLGRIEIKDRLVSSDDPIQVTTAATRCDSCMASCGSCVNTCGATCANCK